MPGRATRCSTAATASRLSDRRPGLRGARRCRAGDQLHRVGRQSAGRGDAAHPPPVPRQSQQSDRHLPPGREIASVCARLARALLLVIDAAYAEYVGANDYEAGVDWSMPATMSVMTRTFSKIYGMGGLRLGWAYCPRAVADVLNRVRGPFNLSTAAMAAGKAALEDTASPRWRASTTTTGGPGWPPSWPSSASQPCPASPISCSRAFPGAGADAAGGRCHLRSQGIIVRQVGVYRPARLPAHLHRHRATSCTPLIAALAEFVGPR